MPKSFVTESIRHHLLRGLERARQGASVEECRAWEQVCQTLTLTREADGSLAAIWARPQSGRVPVVRTRFVLYQRGDLPDTAPSVDPAAANALAADAVVAAIAQTLGLERPKPTDYRLQQEQAFHDQWASSLVPEMVMVREAFEACTAPEHRFILQMLGNIEGRRLLDLGSGLGEAAVYFATKGAKVTACDVSDGMLRMVARVAEQHAVSVTLHRAPAEDTGLAENSFDIVYAGNLLHHVELSTALEEIRRVLVPGGVFVTWDPLAHNPIINVYRRMASAVRTPDEHPLRMADLERFRTRFRNVQWRCFWLLTLAVFLRFYFWERVHPSRERYWKKVLTDAPRLASFYRRLEACDNAILAAVPWLGRYCWNIVVWGTK